MVSFSEYLGVPGIEPHLRMRSYNLSVGNFKCLMNTAQHAQNNSTTTQFVQLDSRLQEASLIMDPKVLRIGMAVNIQRSDGKP